MNLYLTPLCVNTLWNHHLLHLKLQRFDTYIFHIQLFKIDLKFLNNVKDWGLIWLGHLDTCIFSDLNHSNRSLTACWK